jgi:3-oxoadipyl-CoA thiolase
MPEVFICDGVRSPIGRFGGELSGIRTDDLAAHPIRSLLSRNPQLDPAAIDEVVLGCANQAGEDNRNLARMAALLSGLPVSVPGVTVNRLCASGLEAIACAARTIRTGEAGLVIAGGAESMSRSPYVIPRVETPFARKLDIHDTTIGWRLINKRMQSLYGTESMPETAENVAAKYDISRERQDQFALRSQQRACQARASGRLQEEIVPIEPGAWSRTQHTVHEDEHPRPNSSLARLAALAAPFRKDGTVTAGNAAGINDGAAALLLASASQAERHGLRPLARIVCTASAGVEPALMGIGPVPATRRALAMADLAMDDMGVMEFNEAFASQALACLQLLGIEADDERVNPNGGAIALGHPLGMSGARLAITAARELQHRQQRYALCSMCVGVGQGLTMILERA